MYLIESNNLIVFRTFPMCTYKSAIPYNVPGANIGQIKVCSQWTIIWTNLFGQTLEKFGQSFVGHIFVPGTDNVRSGILKIATNIGKKIHYLFKSRNGSKRFEYHLSVKSS